MKKFIYYIFIIGFMFTSCEEDILTFGEEQFNISFSSPDIEVSEASNEILKVPVALARTEDERPLTVKISIDANASTAIEGIDFKVMSDKTLTFPNGRGIQYIEILPIDNDTLEGDKTIVMKIGKANLALVEHTANTASITIVDDEHPLTPLTGTYTVSTSSNYTDVEDYTFDIKVEKDPDSFNKLWILNWYAELYELTIPDKFYVLIDLEAKTISIPMGQHFDSGSGQAKLTSSINAANYNGVIIENTFDFTELEEEFIITIIEGESKGVVLDYYKKMRWTKN